MSRSFPGTNSNYLSVGDVASIDITGTELTISAWLKVTASAVSRFICSKETESSANGQYALYVGATTEKLQFRISDNVPNADAVASANIVPAGVWCHVCGRKTSGLLGVFINGILDAQVASAKSIANSANSFILGNRQANNTPYLGLMAEVAVWNAALSDAEVAALAKGMSPYHFRRNNLRHYSSLLGVATPEADQSGYVANLALTGSVPAGADHAPVGRLLV